MMIAMSSMWVRAQRHATASGGRSRAKLTETALQSNVQRAEFMNGAGCFAYVPVPNFRRPDPDDEFPGFEFPYSAKFHEICQNL